MSGGTLDISKKYQSIQNSAEVAGPGQILEIWEPGNPEIWGPKNEKNESSQNPNPFCPKCWQGLEWPEKYHPVIIWGHFRTFSMGRKNMKDVEIRIFSLVGQWALFTRFGEWAQFTRFVESSAAEYSVCTLLHLLSR